MERISEHISYREGTFSPTAHRLDINNTPDVTQLKAMKAVAKNCFEPLRNHFNVPIKIESFFRCLALNLTIGSTPGSQHIRGQAIDIDDDYGKVTNKEMFYWLVFNVEFDQMIWEFGDDDNPNWVHVSYVSPEENRNRCLKAYREDGKTKYMVI